MIPFTREELAHAIGETLDLLGGDEEEAEQEDAEDLGEDE